MFQKILASVNRLVARAKLEIKQVDRALGSDPYAMTRVLIGVNVGVWGAWQVCDWRFMSRHFVLSEFNTFAQKRYYTALTYSISHQSLLHLVFNSAALWFFGTTAEIYLGRYGLLKLYVTGALGGFAGVWLNSNRDRWRKPVPSTLGASAATSAIFAYFVCRAPNAIVYFWFIPMPAYAVCGILVLLALSQGDSGHISHSGHLGGLVGGALYYLLSKGRF